MLAPDLLVTTLGGRSPGSPRRSSSAPRSPSRCTSRRRVDRTLRPLVVGSQAVPIPVIAPLIVFALGFGFAPKILIVALICFFPIVDQRRRRAARERSRRAQAAALARRDAAGSGCGSWTRRRALPASFTGMRGRGQRRGDRRRVRGVGGLGVRARPPRDHRQRPARDARARSPPPSLLIGRWRSRSTPRSRRSSGASSPGRRGRAHEAARRILAALVALAGCGEKAEPTGDRPGTPGAVHGDARLLPERRPRRALRGPGGRPVREGRARRQAPAAAGPVRAAEAARGRPRRRRDLLRARAAARARQRRREHRRRRRAGADAADVADLAARGRRRHARRPRGQARRHRRHPVPERVPEVDPGRGGRRPELGEGDQRRLQPHARDDLRAASTRRSARSGTTRASTSSAATASR